MADLKDSYSPAFLVAVGQQFQRVLPTFDTARFRSDCVATDWDDLKLMERRDRITARLHDQLPADFDQAAAILRQVGPHFTGLTAVCFPNYVATYGLDHWQTSMALLAQLTQYSSAEFAIRPFLVKYPAETSQQMLTWAHSDNADVRRLASEGMRPRLPWGMRLPQFMADPTPVLTVLQALITDDSEYVQKSVANNLNDISKDHPEVTLAFAQKYWGQGERVDWVLTRGLRTLFKQGNPAVLALQGYAIEAAQQVTATLSPASQSVVIGETAALTYTVQSQASRAVPVYLGYRVHYIRQNQTTTYKDFFLKRTTLQPQATLQGTLTTKWRQLTTRRLYPGSHAIELLVNTRPVAASQVVLQAAPEKS